MRFWWRRWWWWLLFWRTFNSLYEIQYLLVQRHEELFSSFNSLYEIPNSYEKSYHYFYKLSILFMRFRISKNNLWYWTVQLSILFMRFFTWGVSKIRANKKSFNSLYEILLSDFDPSGENIYTFQFSLWDSKFWLVKNGLVKKLSILFMRFCNLEVGVIRIKKIDFQFSLWDSLSMSEVVLLDPDAFNSLYEIRWRKWGYSQFFNSFNSLYEIL